ncbi:MAG: hypothetical protein ACYDH2_05405 [Anaerolineaceae bacterium]
MVAKLDTGNQTAMGKIFIIFHRERNKESMQELSMVNALVASLNTQDQAKVRAKVDNALRNADENDETKRAVASVESYLSRLAPEDQQNLRVLIGWWAGNKTPDDTEAVRELAIRYYVTLNEKDRLQLSRLAEDSLAKQGPGTRSPKPAAV